ncbi:MAG: CAP domain-containing protein [Planctomycetes bacterium]|nr:CAP domain-containing protein [Planctomycetota bacterium]
MGIRKALVLLLLASALAAKEREYRGRRVNVDEPPAAQLSGHVPLRPVEGEVTLDGTAFAIEKGSTGPRVATSPGGAVLAPLASGKTVTFKWKDGKGAAREAVMRFEEEGGRWGRHAARGFRYKIADEEITLLDLDADGRFDIGRDGFLAGDSTVACPLVAVIVLGRETVRILSLEPDGSALRAETAPVAGTEQQIDAMVALNRLRMQHGLLPVPLDEKLSLSCTAHARYLAMNHWDSSTNPHSQSLGPKGASPEGEQAAKRSAISARAPVDAIASYYLTYYHRLEMMSATLPRIGVNAEPPGLAVVDTGDGFADAPPAEGAEAAGGGPAWSDPYFVPADGSVGFPVAAIPEMPRDPVPDMGRRGCALTMYFRPPGPGIAGFRAELVALNGRRETRVPFLVADRGGYGWVYGIVPEGPLRGDTWHRATWIYTLDGKEVRHAVTFKTR